MSRKMKDSGVSWIKEIPEEWQTIPLRRGMSFINEINNPVKFSNILSLIKDKGVVRYEDKGAVGNNKKEDLTKYKLAYKDTIVVNSMNAKIGSVGISSFDGCVSPVYYVLSPRENFNISYLGYIFETREYQKYIGSFGKGILEIREKISPTDLKQTLLPCPPIDNQIKISTFLNKKCKIIDDEIRVNKKSIQLWGEYKESLINCMVSPQADWKDVKIKHICKLKGRIGWQGLTSNEYLSEGSYLITGTDFVDGKIDWEKCVRISERRFYEAPDIHIKDEDLLITKDGTIGKVAIVENCPDKVSLNSGVMLIRPKKEKLYYVGFIYYILKSKIFWDWYNINQRGNSTIKHLYQGQFYNFAFSIPSYDTQKEIYAYLNSVCSKIDGIIDNKYLVVSKLEEYKKSLIYEAVTGKIEV